MNRKVDMIVDLQFGSTGKGLIAGHMAMENGYHTCVTANMPNAGHTFIDSNGFKMIHKVLPNGVVSSRCQVVLIGPGAVFDVERLFDEMDHLALGGYRQFKVGIHPNAVPLQSEYAESEAVNVAIGSTMQGSGAAMVQKIKRDPSIPVTAGQIFGEDSNITDRIAILSHDQYREQLDRAPSILAEGAQGFSLGINGRFYPYCTSRDCGPARFLSDMGIPHRWLRGVMGTARLHPIRVGSPEGGYSGDGYLDQSEITWGDLGVEPERTTVTGRVRRVFTYSAHQMEEAIWAMCPDWVFLNFCNYQPECVHKIKHHIESLPGKPVVTLTGWGPTINDVRKEP